MLLILIAIIAYMIGSIPTGAIWVKWINKEDITQIGSGKTSSTNAMRAGGVRLFILTSISDLIKGSLAVLLARWIMPGSIWAEILAAIAVVAGHNWSIWLKLIKGKFIGGAGAAPNMGAAIVFWPPVIFIAIPMLIFIVFVIGYASLFSIIFSVTLVLIFSLRWLFYGSPWQYILYAIITTLIVIIGLRNNLKRLLTGTENRVGIFAKRERQKRSSQE